MLNITKLWCGADGSMDHLRYGEGAHKKPIVVWNSTQCCNLRCIHCYSSSEDKSYPNELTTEEAKVFIGDLAAFKVPVLLFSGGEPLMRPDLFELAQYAVERKIRAVLSTNGTLITPQAAEQLNTAGVSYVGVSVDGAEETNNKFRATHGAFQAALQGIRNCKQAGVKPGLRFTVTKYNLADVPQIFDLIEAEHISRVCFYHLAYAGRGTKIADDDLAHQQTRDFIDYILAKAEELHKTTEILTVDNHTDSAYLYLKLKQTDPQRAQKVYELLLQNGGNSSGEGIGCVDAQGGIHPDQFWRHHTLGNIRQRRFSEIWGSQTDPLLSALKNRKNLLTGKCHNCRFLDICNGNLRVRAEAVYDDVWAADPACYLTQEETHSSE